MINKINLIILIDVQTHARDVRDKSSLRKSNLNVANSFEDTDADMRRYRRQRSREGSISGSPLHSIIEEDKKKQCANEKLQTHIRNSSDSSNEALSPGKEKQSIYIRQPITADNSDNNSSSMSTISNKHSIYIRPTENDPSVDTPNAPRRIRRNVLGDQPTNKIEIDSDNIETPPSIRKNFNTPHMTTISKNLRAPRPLHSETAEEPKEAIELKKLINPPEQEVLGDGQFDRHSSARRTRRFKRPTDLSSNDETTNTKDATTSPDSISDSSFSITTLPASSVSVAALDAKVKFYNRNPLTVI